MVNLYDYAMLAPPLQADPSATLAANHSPSLLAPSARAAVLHSLEWC